MEQFDGKAPTGVKEKSIYQLHLDTPRIIIISSVIIGIIIISVLIGMNLKKQGGPGEGDIAKKDAGLELPLHNAEKELNALANKVPGMGDPSQAMKPGESPEKDKAVQKDPANAIIPGGPAKVIPAHPEKDSAASNDILTKDNIKEIIPPVKEASHDKNKRKKLAKSEKKKDADDGARLSANRKDREKKGKKNKVVEVASKTKDGDDSSPRGRGYVIQIGSYDNRAKADAEKARLEKLSYDAFVDKTMKGGKKYFRVRVGPIASKKSAINTLNDIQDNTRYKDSFMVKE